MDVCIAIRCCCVTTPGGQLVEPAMVRPAADIAIGANDTAGFVGVPFLLFPFTAAFPVGFVAPVPLGEFTLDRFPTGAGGHGVVSVETVVTACLLFRFSADAEESETGALDFLSFALGVALSDASVLDLEALLAPVLPSRTSAVSLVTSTAASSEAAVLGS